MRTATIVLVGILFGAALGFGTAWLNDDPWTDDPRSCPDREYPNCATPLNPGPDLWPRPAPIATPNAPPIPLMPAHVVPDPRKPDPMPAH